jgi:hypothetical protein
MTGRSRRRFLLAGTLFLALTRSGLAEEYGQWHWDGSISYSDRNHRFESDGRETSSYEERSLGLGLGVDGYVLNPAIASFRLGLDAVFEKYASGFTLDQKRWGGRFDARILPLGIVPIRLYFDRHEIRFDGLGSDDPLAARSRPSVSTSLGGGVRVRSGPLTGLRASFDSTILEPLDPDEKNRTEERETLEWSGSTRKFQHHWQIDRVARVYGYPDVRIDDTTLTIDEHGRVAPLWRLDATFQAIRREYKWDGLESIGTELGRFGAHLVRVNGRDSVDFGYTADLTRTRNSPDVESHSFVARAVWRPTSTLQVIPSVGFDFQKSDGTTFEAPNAGLSANWNHPGTVDVSTNGSASMVWIDWSSPDIDRRETVLRILAGTSIGAGAADRLRGTLELSWARNDAREVGESRPELPDLGANLGGIGIEDRTRIRFVLSRQTQNSGGRIQLDFTRRESDAGLATNRFTADDTTALADLTWGSLHAFANAGRSELDSELAARQSFDYLGAGLGWSPWTGTSLRASWRADTQKVAWGPDIEGRRGEAELAVDVGAFRIRGTAYLNSERFEEGSERVDRGFVASISRTFGGWLPIISAPERRGVVK